MTAFYMFRLIYMTFFGTARMAPDVEHHIHESPKSMIVPLVILAVFSVFVGFVGVSPSLARLVGMQGQTNLFANFLSPVFENHVEIYESETLPVEKKRMREQFGEYMLVLLPLAGTGLALLLAKRAYGKPGQVREPIAEASPSVYDTLLNKYYVDEFYDKAFTGREKVGDVRLGVLGAGDAMFKVDSQLIDGGVNGAGWWTRWMGALSSWWDRWIIDGVCVNGPALFTGMLSRPVRWVQLGLVQWYALVMVIGVAGLLWYYLLR
jgi:NADH-quinone oxidoreductase subunit L